MTPYKFPQVLRFGKNESSQKICQKYEQGPNTLMILIPYKIPSLF
jgi:hypothetical protein